MSGLVKAAGLPTEAAVLELATLSSPPTYIPVANTGDYTGPGSTYQVQDVSAHGHRARRKVTTLIDSGTVAFQCWFIPTVTGGYGVGTPVVSSHTDHTNGLQAIHERGDLRAWRLRYNDDSNPANETAQYFNAYISKMSRKSPVAGVHSADAEFLIDDTVLTGTVGGGLSSAVFAPSE